MKKNRAFLLTLIIVFIIIVSSIIYPYLSFSEDKVSKTAKNRDTIVITYGYPFKIDNPISPDNNCIECNPIINLVYEQLIYYDPIAEEFIPALSIRWETNLNHTKWVFKIRRNVYFHDGEVLTAHYVKKSIEYAIHFDYSNDVVRNMLKHITSIEVIDNYTLEIKLDQPLRLDLVFASPNSIYIFKSVGTLLYGTGPYRITRYCSKYLILEKFNKWWGWGFLDEDKVPDKIIVVFEENSYIRKKLFEENKINVTLNIPLARKSFLPISYDYIDVLTYRFHVIRLNLWRYPTNKRLFRQALTYLIPWDTIEYLYKYQIHVADDILPYKFPGYVGNLTYSHNYTEALKLITKSSFEKNYSNNIELEIVVLNGSAVDEYIVNKLVNELSRIGIKARVIKVDSYHELKQYVRKLYKDPYEAPHLIIDIVDPVYLTPYGYFYSFFKVFKNTSATKEYVELSAVLNSIDEAIALEGIDIDKAFTLYNVIKTKIYDEALIIPLYSEKTTIYYKIYVKIRRQVYNPLYPYTLFFQYVEVDITLATYLNI